MAMPIADPAILARLPRELGPQFLSYVCAVDLEELELVLRGEAELSEGGKHSLDRVVASLDSHHDIGGYSAAAYELYQYDQEAEMTIANSLRVRAGGSLPGQIPEEGLEHDLALMARDAYPVSLLAPVYAQMPGPAYLMRSFDEHPIAKRFEKAVLDDPLLRKLFVFDGPESIEAGGYYFSSGHGGGIQQGFVAVGLIEAAYWTLSRSARLGGDELVATSLQNLRALRDLIAGRPVRVKARVGMAGVEIPEGSVVKTPWGSLRRATSMELQEASRLPGSPGGVVLEREVEERLLFGPPTGDDDTLTQAFNTFQTNLQDACDRLALAVFVSGTDEETATVARTWLIVDDVITITLSVSGGAPTWPFETRVLEAEAQAELRKWADLVEQEWAVQIAVGVRRVISARAQRLNSEDGLIDAVIALENLFSPTDRGELNFRIAAACAHLIAEDGKERGTIFKDVKKVYSQRSRLVHGGLATEDSAEARDAALLYLRRCYRALLRDRPELLQDKQRADVLILGG